MPLPSNTSLSLLGYSRPGDALQSKPKQAMLVRLSAESLNALSTLPPISVQLGDSPSLFIGDEAFPMKHSTEETIHELFLRASSASKKSAPLKLHATVIGKLAVERELVDEVQDKVRESTKDAAAQRNSRTTVFMETPPVIPVNTKRREEPPSNMFHKPNRPSGTFKAPPMAAAASSSAVSKPVGLTQAQKDLLAPARKRIIQHLSLNGETTEDKLFGLLGASERTSTAPRQFQDLLSQIAELTLTKNVPNAPRSYRLKPETWKEVRPYEWSIFSEQDQIKVARFARNMFKSLHIPESDPLWQHVVFRKPTPATQPGHAADMSRVSSASSVDDKAHARNPEVVKRGITSKAAKDRISKPKPDTKGEITAKDESARAPPPRAMQQTEKPSRRIAESPSPDAAPRTGQQIEKIRKTAESPRPDTARRAGQQPEKPMRRAAESPRPDPASRAVQHTEKTNRKAAESPRPDPAPRAVQQTEKANRKTAESPRPDVATGRNQPIASKQSARPSTSQLDRDPPKAAPPKNRVNASQARPMDRVPSVASSNGRSTPVPDERTNSAHKMKKTYRDDDRAAMAPTPEREKRPMQTERAKKNGPVESTRDDARPVKRKMGDRANDDAYDPPPASDVQKRRRPERQHSPSVSSTKEDRSRDVSSVRKSNVDLSPPERPAQKKPPVQSSSMKPPPKKRNESPPPPAKRQTASTIRERMPSESATSSKSQVSHTSKTSATKPRRRSPIYTSSEEEEPPPVVSRPPANRPSASGANTTTVLHVRNNNTPRPLPTDHAALRERYDTSYLDYLTSLRTLTVQRGKYSRLLKKDDDLVGSGTVTDSDGDADMVDLEELAKLTKEHQRLTGELETIQKIFERNPDGASPDTLTP